MAIIARQYHLWNGRNVCWCRFRIIFSKNVLRKNAWSDFIKYFNANQLNLRSILTAPKNLLHSIKHFKKIMWKMLDMSQLYLIQYVCILGFFFCKHWLLGIRYFSKYSDKESAYSQYSQCSPYYTKWCYTNNG